VGSGSLSGPLQFPVRTALEVYGRDPDGGPRLDDVQVWLLDAPTDCASWRVADPPGLGRVIIMQVQNVLGFDLAGGNYPVGVTLLNDTFLGRFSEPSDAGLLLTERATSGSVFFNTVGAQGVLGSFNVEMVDRDRGNPGGGIQRGAVPPARPLKHRPGCPVCLWAILVQRVRSPSW